MDVEFGGIDVTEHGIAAEFDMASRVHDEALAAGWFHLGPISSGVGARPFGPGSNVRVQVRLDPRYISGLGLVVPTSAGVTELLEKLDPTSPLRWQQSWYAMTATREVPAGGLDDAPELAAAMADGSLREGYHTAWAGERGGDGLPLVASLAEQLELRFQGVDALAEQTGFRWKLSGSDASWTSTAIVDETAGWCVLYSSVDSLARDADRSVLVERASDLNTALLFGAWHVGGGSSTVGFRSGVEIPDRIAASELLNRLITRHLDIVDEYASSFAESAT
ncbi:MAG: hypothetical protein ABIR32_09680 [Ilumatobacteraceae bacterium]